MPLNSTENPSPFHEVCDRTVELLGQLGSLVTYVVLDVIPAKIDAATEWVLRSDGEDNNDN